MVTELFTWGTDLSGSQQGACGIGGLLFQQRITQTTNTTYYHTSDANGNVAGYYKSDGSGGSKTVYSPYGNSLAGTSVTAFGFSTKLLIGNSQFYYFGHRFYSPNLGRWLNRDPMGEIGGTNLYRFVRNCPISLYDVLGLYEYEWEDNFTENEKKMILDSIERVSQRCKELIKQLENINKELSESKCPSRYTTLIANLNHLKKIFSGMVDEIEDNGFNLEIYRKELGPEKDASYWNASWAFWYDDELTLDDDWFSGSVSNRDIIMFHEITHGQGTNHPDVDYNNAHMIDDLMYVDFARWTVFLNDRRNSDNETKE